MGLTAPGVGSGLDVKGLVETLVNAERIPAQTRLSQKATKISTNLTALGQVKSTLAKLQDNLGKLYNINEFYKMKISSSDSDHFSVSATEKANPGIYNITVNKMAQRHSLSSQPTTATNLGAGTLTIQLGTYNAGNTSFTNNPDKAPIVINIGPGNDSLQNICDTINKTNPAVQANIVQDNQGARITITSTETGEKTAMKITVSNNSGNTLSNLAYDPTTGTPSPMQETVKAQNSEILVNGITLSNSSNTLKDVISGITLDLKKAEENKNITLNMEQDKGALSTLVKDFIKQYNDSISALNSFTAYDTASKKAGPLQSDASVRNLKAKLSALATEFTPTGDGKVQSLVDLGIKTDSKGLLVMDDKKFNAMLESNYKDIGALFAKTGTASDPDIRINKLDKSVKAGTYNVNLDTYLPGTSMSGSIGGHSASSSNGIILKGSGALSQLALDISGGSTGPRGSVTIRDGLAVRLDSLLESYLSDKGDLTQKTRQLSSDLDNLDKENSILLERMEVLEKRYLKQFNALDAVMTNLKKTTGMVDQLGNLPKIQ